MIKYTHRSLVANDERVLAAIGDGGFLIVRRDGMDVRDNRDTQAFAWRVLDHQGITLDAGADLHEPYSSDQSGEERVLRGLRALISFLLACAESPDEDSENYSLFSRPVREWAEMLSDELQLLSSQLDLIIDGREVTGEAIRQYMAIEDLMRNAMTYLDVMKAKEHLDRLRQWEAEYPGIQERARRHRLNF